MKARICRIVRQDIANDRGGRQLRGYKEPHVRRNRRGFTMIEILVVIGIIAALAAMLFLGFKHVSKSGRENQTHVALQNLRGMLTEYETGGAALDDSSTSFAGILGISGTA